MTRLLTLLVASALLAPTPAAAEVITEFTTGASANILQEIPGQSFTTPAGGPWYQITFNFFSDQSPAATPSASGTLYLFDRPYTGVVNDLGLATTADGLLATTSGVSGGVYQFDPSFTLQPNNQYFAYADGRVQFSTTGAGSYPGGNRYISGGPFDAFIDSPSGDNNFRVSGTVVARTEGIPEPAALGVFGVLAGVGLLVRRRKPARV